MLDSHMKILLSGLLALALHAAAAPNPTAPTSDRDLWNRGYDAYVAGDATNALATLRGLVLSRTHGARAAEVVGALRAADRAAALAQAKDAAGVNAAAAALEPLRRAGAAADESAEMMQLALRAAPDDPRANRNFTRAVTGLAALRDDLHVQEVLARTKDQAPQTLLAQAKRTALDVLTAQAALATNEAAVAVAQGEALARRAGELADALIPLKRQILQSVTNEQQAAELVGDVEATRDRARRAVEQLEDLSPEAADNLAAIETAFHRYWKSALEPPQALDADLLAQTNAYMDVEQENGRDWQTEALDATRLFRARFPEWAPRKAQEIQQKIQQGDTNAVPFTKEAQEEIAQLATRVEERQRKMLKTALPPDQLEILRDLSRIRELMPKDNGGGGAQNQQQNPQQPPDKNQDKDKNQDQDKNQNQQQNSDQGQDEPPQENEPQEQPEKEPPPETSQEQKDVENLLRKAQERSEEHENEKKARMNKARLPPNERDW